MDFLVAMTYIGAVVGAGFASGQELWQFFARWGFSGWLGILLAGLLFALAGGAILWLAGIYGWQNHQALLQGILPAPLAWLLDAALSVFLLAMLGVMLSAMGALVQEQFQLPACWGILGFWLLLWPLLKKESGKLLKLQSVLVPPLILLVAAVAGIGLASGHWQPQETAALLAQNQGRWQGLWFGLLYVGYNLLTGFSVLVAFSQESRPRAAVAGGSVLAVLGCLAVLVLCKYPNVGSTYYLPLLYLAGRLHPALAHVYGLVMLIAILTTAVSSGYALCCRFGRRHWRRTRCCLLWLALPLAFFDFSWLVEKVYPVFGYLGILLVLAILGRAAKVWFLSR